MRPLNRSPRGQEATLPEKLSGDGPMLIWTAPSEEVETSHRRHPGGDGDSVFTSRTSSPIKACTEQSRHISWECRNGAGGQEKASHGPGGGCWEGCWAAQERRVSPGLESLLTAGRPQSAQKKMEKRVLAWSGYLSGAGRRHKCWLSGAEEMLSGRQKERAALAEDWSQSPHGR